MLKELRISNLVLVEFASITFSPGLTAITGETGAGKTVLLEALKLVTGGRAATDSIRHGSTKATIEAEFAPPSSAPIKFLLENAGIDWEKNDPLLLKREISSEGRSRAFINCHMVSLSLLQTIGNCLVDFTDQHAHYHLRKEEYQRTALDLFGRLLPLTKTVSEAKAQLLQARKELEVLNQASYSSQKEHAIATSELEELMSSNLKLHEEITLQEEHQRLAHVQELEAKVRSIYTFLEDSPHAILPGLRRYSPLLKSAYARDPSLKEADELFTQGSVALSELRHILQTYLSLLENNPQRLTFLEERLAIYHKLRRKYGDPFTYIETLTKKLGKIDSLEEEIANVQRMEKEAESTLHLLRVELTEKRKIAALALSHELTRHLQSLHMPHAILTILVEESPDLLEGDDRIDFLLYANRGEKSAYVKEHASGGELSRLMLALQTALAEHQATPILVFDEVDANVGGQTASAIAQQLAHIAEHRQVLCVTHFSQVAKKCHHHIRIFKEEAKERTLTHLEILDPLGREKELLRMNG